MEKKEVIKHSGAIQISTNQISLLQRKIWNILLANAFDDLLIKDEYSIKIKDLAEILKFDSNDIELIKEAVTKMQKVLVQWNVLEKDNEAWISSQFLGEVNITKQSGVIWYTWGKYLREKLCNPTMYAKINLAIQSKFKSKYSLILYELCVDYFIRQQGKGETPWISIEDFKKLMGVESDKYCQEYKRLNNFVIKKAIKEINEKSDIFVTIDVKKEARKVVALKFHIAPTPCSNNILTRLIKAPKQEELSFKSEDEERKELYEKLTKAFTLSNRQAQEILTMYDYDEIKEILDMVERKIKRNEILNIGAYTYMALKDQYQPRKSIITIEREQKAEAKANEEKRQAKEKEIINGLIDEHERYKNKTIKEYISRLSKEDREAVKKTFEESLDDDFFKNIYMKSGIESPMLRAIYMEFLTTKYLKDEMLDFRSFAQERGILLEHDQEGWRIINIKDLLRV